jgi:dienelactone hydrolase
MGGFAVLYAVDCDLAGQYFREGFRAAVAYYPGCDIPAPKMTAPTLILIGEADEANPVERCREMVAHARPDGVPIALTVYPGVHHNFDVAQMTPASAISAIGSNTTSRRPRMRKRRRAPSSLLISPGHLPGEPTAK